jgi:putative hydrolase of HD superfamily
MKAADIIDICLNAESLKRVPRTGWILAGQDSSSCEAVASHCWGTCMFSLLIAHQLRSEGKTVDLEKAMTMAVVHDLAEAVMSDIPHGAIELGGRAMESAKREAERNALGRLLGPLGTLGESLKKEWEELKLSKTVEARVVIAADRLDMLAHAISLEKGGFPSRNLDGFFDRARDEIENLHIDIVKELFEGLHSMHRASL